MNLWRLKKNIIANILNKIMTANLYFLFIELLYHNLYICQIILGYKCSLIAFPQSQISFPSQEKYFPVKV